MTGMFASDKVDIHYNSVNFSALGYKMLYVCVCLRVHVIYFSLLVFRVFSLAKHGGKRSFFPDSINQERSSPLRTKKLIQTREIQFILHSR